MPMPTLSFLLGLLLLGYLFTFVAFAVLRIVTGVSIQRVGYSGFRRIAFSPRHGIQVNIRGVGPSVHRPTFALPTWCSLVITDLVLTVDLQALQEKDKAASKSNGHANGSASKSEKKDAPVDEEDEEGHGKLWRQLTDVKEKIKKLHSNINWIRLVDLVVTAATVDIVGAGSLRLERITVSVDTRSKTVDRSRLFQHYKTSPDKQTPAEWKCMVRSALFTPDGKDSTEILDYTTLNIHGMLHNKLQGLRDASIALKLGRVNLPYDDLVHARNCADLIRGKYAQPPRDEPSDDVSLADALAEIEQPGSREDRIMRTVSDSRAFIASILRGIQEVQFAVGFLGLTRRMDIESPSGKAAWFNLAMKEVGLDVLRLDPKSPAHRMYFLTDDVAHQGMLTAIAISAGIDDGHEHPERMAYIPMITATVKTTLPSRTIHYSKTHDVTERNTNMLYANFVCTSPSIDLDPKHLPLVHEMLKQREQTPLKKSNKIPNRHQLISQLLPKSFIKLSIQEPVIRVSLPPMDKSNAAEDDYDLLISSVSTISVELESSHAAQETNHYGVSTQYRHTRHQLYYQTAANERHDLLQSDTVEVKLDVNALPEASVTLNGRFQTFTLYLVRPDICEGIRQIVGQLRKNVLARQDGDEKQKPSFLRTIPSWLEQLHVEGSDFGFEVAGVDEQICKNTRGFALQLQSWTTDYKSQRETKPGLFENRRGSVSRAAPLREKHSRLREGESPRRRPQSLADGRRLTVHLQNLEGFILDSTDDSQPVSFMSVPRFEVACSTSTDHNGPIFHVNSYARSVLLQWSLYYHFSMGVAIMVIRKTFLDHHADQVKKERKPRNRPQTLQVSSDLTHQDDVARHEITTIDFKSNLVQLKARMPADPPMMVQLFDIETGRHRYGTPFLRTRLGRMYVRSPRTKSAWSRIVSIKVLRLDIRELKRKVGKQHVTERSIDMAMETIRLGVPHSLVVHSIFDNITNVVKVAKQLHHHFSTGSSEYVLAKEPEGPKHVPRITLRAQMLLFDIEDSSFEFKLNSIYRAGLVEQKQRLAREEAFRLKEKTLSRNRGSSRLRARSTHLENRSRSRTRTQGKHEDQRKTRSANPESNRTRQDSQRNSRRPMRYNAEGACDLSSSTHLSMDAAREKLNKLNSQSWKTRIDRVLSFQSTTMREIRNLLGSSDDLPDDNEQQEPILALSQRPGLLVVFMSDLAITVDKPSFPMEDYPNFLHDVGKGMPKDMKYGLLIPMNIHVTTGEARVQLRDYPLPLIHIPALANGQSPRLPSLSMRTDFVIAEEFRDSDSQRFVNVQIVPEDRTSTGKGYSLDVPRTISPVKTYSDMKFEINTSGPTKITWGTSYQPAIQDTMQVVEGFTKPPIDTSDRVGFWDKIRLSFHSRVNVAWKGDGDVHLVLKGSRDPYVVTGQGAGLAMVWRNDVRWNIAQSKDPRQFMTVDSGEYMLAVPDFSSYARRAQDADEGDDGSISSGSSTGKRDAVFKKVVMKLSGNVRWLAGLVFERELKDGSRSFGFKPHYDVVLKHPDAAKAPRGEEYDAFRDFRSHFIHMSIAIAAPQDRDWSVSNTKSSDNYNSIHLTPRFFSHFFSWWSMFSGVMSLPIRQGPLWGAVQKKSKKFGRHLATLKYNLLLSPLYVSHVYKHKDAEDYEDNVVAATGLKMRLDSFILDLHQRREYFDIKGHEGAASKTSSGMRINQAQLDFINADLRALSARIAGTSTEDIEKASDETLATLHSQIPAGNMAQFEIPDNDFTWIDMDDFVELDWILPAESDPKTMILPLAYAPRFTYFRQTDHSGFISGDPTRTSSFGDEPTHYCVMSAQNDPRRVQTELIEQRLSKLREQKAQNQRAMGDYELKSIRTTDNAIREEIAQTLETLSSNAENLQKKYDFLQLMLETLTQRLEHDDPSAVPDLETSEEFFEAKEKTGKAMHEVEDMDATPLADYSSDFNNRFIVHNSQIKWNNSLRNIILRYIHQNSQRRGFVYYMSRRAVKFLLDIIEERKKSQEEGKPARNRSTATAETDMSQDSVDDETTVQDRIEELLRDGRNYVSADDPDTNRTDSKANPERPNEDIAVEYTPLNTYQFRLIAPQVQLQSEKNPKAAVLVAAKGMQLKVVQIMDKDRVSDDVSGLVQRRFTAAADSLQVFVTTTKTFKNENLHMYSANTYGAKAGSYWPPWVPMEIMFEFQTNPFGFHRIVHRTSASLRYDKYNALRLKGNEDVTGGKPETSSTAERPEEAESGMDHVWLEFPQFRAICDSAQYYALYIIVMDLLLYHEPLEKTRSERLEKIILASDFSDLSGAPEMVYSLQERIRQLEEIKMQFQVNAGFLDRQGWKDRIALDHDLAGCEDELFFIMKAITTAQQRIEDRREQENATGLLHLNMSAKEIAWHLIRDKGESLMEFQLKNASFDRTDNNDGSNHNCMTIERINGFNLLPEAIYPEIIAPFVDEARGFYEQRSGNMLRVHWLMLEAIAGIPVVDYFEVDLVPLKLQVEREVAKRLFEYIFPGVGANAFDGGGFSPFMVKHMLPTQEEEDETQEERDDTSTPMIQEHPSEVQSTERTGSVSLEQRLKPTLVLPKRQKKPDNRQGLGITHANQYLQGLSIFQHGDRSRNSLAASSSRPPQSRSGLASSSNIASSITRSPSERSIVTMKSDAGSNEDKNKRFGLHRSGSDGEKKKEKERSDDLTQMMNRANNYMTLAFVKLPSMTLCLSYKGQGKRNIEDVHDLVFRLPTLEYRNKTWSNLDLALQLKKDVIRALISHAGAIVGNKFSHHKPTRQQQSRLREIANMSSLMSSNALTAGVQSDSGSIQESNSGEADGRPSTASARPSTLNRTLSTDSTTSATSKDDARDGQEPDSNLHGHANSIGQKTPDRRMSLPRSTRSLPRPNEGDPPRPRTSSISRNFSGFGARLRSRGTDMSDRTGSGQNNGSNNNVSGSSPGNTHGSEEADEGKKKSKVLLGGQRLLGKFSRD